MGLPWDSWLPGPRVCCWDAPGRVCRTSPEPTISGLHPAQAQSSKKTFVLPCLPHYPQQGRRKSPSIPPTQVLSPPRGPVVQEGRSCFTHLKPAARPACRASPIPILPGASLTLSLRWVQSMGCHQVPGLDVVAMGIPAGMVAQAMVTLFWSRRCCHCWLPALGRAMGWAGLCAGGLPPTHTEPFSDVQPHLGHRAPTACQPCRHVPARGGLASQQEAAGIGLALGATHG